MKTIARSALIAATFCLSGLPALAEIVVTDAYARSSGPSAKAGAVFMQLGNTSDEGDRLVSARSDAAMRVELHTHVSDQNGVMMMTELEEGIELPGQGSHLLERGGDHVMLMGLTEALEQGETIMVTLTFEKAGEITVEVPVDLDR